MNQPLVSILMNCYNGEKYLAQAIDSVLAQTYSNWELIFWDNQSSDGNGLKPHELAKKHTWSSCAADTFSFVAGVAAARQRGASSPASLPDVGEPRSEGESV